MIVAGAWTSALIAEMSAQGLTGPDVPVFAAAVADGSASHVIGKPFVTVDTGTIPGTGAGTGVGITGVVGGTIATLIFSLASASFGGSGPDLLKLCTAIGAACQSQLLTALLTSAHSPVFLGSGIVTPGTVGVVGGAWGSAILSAGSVFTGPQWAAFTAAIGGGCGTHVSATGTGVVTITGSPTGIPVPGGGAGAGTIS